MFITCVWRDQIQLNISASAGKANYLLPQQKKENHNSLPEYSAVHCASGQRQTRVCVWTLHTLLFCPSFLSSLFMKQSPALPVNITIWPSTIVGTSICLQPAASDGVKKESGDESTSFQKFNSSKLIQGTRRYLVFTCFFWCQVDALSFCLKLFGVSVPWGGCVCVIGSSFVFGHTVCVQWPPHECKDVGFQSRDDECYRLCYHPPTTLSHRKHWRWFPVWFLKHS